jgi:hypothetical protein
MSASVLISGTEGWLDSDATAVSMSVSVLVSGEDGSSDFVHHIRFTFASRRVTKDGFPRTWFGMSHFSRFCIQIGRNVRPRIQLMSSASARLVGKISPRVFHDREVFLGAPGRRG